MARPKKETQISNPEVKDVKSELATLLRVKLPTLFDRHPEITGDLNNLIDEILEITNA